MTTRIRVLLADDHASEAEAKFRALARDDESPAIRLEAADWAERAAFVQTLTSTASE